MNVRKDGNGHVGMQTTSKNPHENNKILYIILTLMNFVFFRMFVQKFLKTDLFDDLLRTAMEK